MINRHRLKALGLALAAVLAMSIGGASLASAAELHSESAPVVITGTQEGAGAYDVQFGQVACTTVDLDATTPAGATTDTTITLVPFSGGCTFGGVATTVDTNGCHFMFHIASATSATVTIECPPGQELTLTGGNKCTLHVAGGQDVGTVTLANIGSGATREVTANLGGLSSITYTQTPGTGVGKCTAVTTSNGKLTGSATFTGETDTGGAPTHVGLFVT